MTDPDPRAAVAYQLYVVQRMSLETIEAKLRTSRRRLKRWIVERGGEIRGHGGNRPPRMMQTAPGKTGWRKDPRMQCFIGVAPEHTFSDGGAWYCASECDWTDCQRPEPCALLNERTRVCEKSSKPKCRWLRDKCSQPVTVENLWAYATILAERARVAEIDKTREARRVELAKAQIRCYETRETVQMASQAHGRRQ